MPVERAIVRAVKGVVDRAVVRSVMGKVSGKRKPAYRAFPYVVPRLALFPNGQPRQASQVRSPARSRRGSIPLPCGFSHRQHELGGSNMDGGAMQPSRAVWRRSKRATGTLCDECQQGRRLVGRDSRLSFSGEQRNRSSPLPCSPPWSLELRQLPDSRRRRQVSARLARSASRPPTPSRSPPR